VPIDPRAAPGCAYRSCVAGPGRWGAASGVRDTAGALCGSSVRSRPSTSARPSSASPCYRCFSFRERDRQRCQNLFGKLSALCAQIAARHPLIKPHTKYLCRSDLYPTTCLVSSTRESAKKTVSPCRCIIAIHLSPRLIINTGPGGGGPAGQRAFRQVMGTGTH
jgi:hypothetical protein